MTFINWYKRRINRIYPTVFAWALICCFVFSSNWNLSYILTSGGGFFVKCIMVFYLFFFPLKTLPIRQLISVAIAYYIVGSAVYFILDHSDKSVMYEWSWSQYFLPMLMGAIIGKAYAEKTPYPMRNLGIIGSFTLLGASVLVYYLLIYVTRTFPAMESLTPFIIIPQLGVVYGFYRLCCKQSETLCQNKMLYSVIMFIGSICLEIYIVQPDILKAFPLISLFPFNIIIVFMLIIAAAFLLKVLSRIWQQTFMEKDYCWKEIIKLY